MGCGPPSAGRRFPVRHPGDGAPVNRRLTSVLTALAVAAVLSLLLVGTTGGGVGIPIVGIVPVLALVLSGASLLVRRGRIPDLGWAGPLSRRSVTAAAAAPAGGPVGRPAATRRQVVVALGRVEARELAMSAWFAVGVGFCFIIFLAFGVLFVDDAERSWADLFNGLPLLAHPLVGMTVVAAHRAVTRSRRDDTDELFDTCPVPATTRLAAHLSTAWVAVATFLAFIISLATPVP